MLLWAQRWSLLMRMLPAPDCLQRAGEADLLPEENRAAETHGACL
jgi:hypothetical protein